MSSRAQAPVELDDELDSSTGSQANSHSNASTCSRLGIHDMWVLERQANNGEKSPIAEGHFKKKENKKKTRNKANSAHYGDCCRWCNNGDKEIPADDEGMVITILVALLRRYPFSFHDKQDLDKSQLFVCVKRIALMLKALITYWYCRGREVHLSGRA